MFTCPTYVYSDITPIVFSKIYAQLWDGNQIVNQYVWDVDFEYVCRFSLPRLKYLFTEVSNIAVD